MNRLFGSLLGSIGGKEIKPDRSLAALGAADCVEEVCFFCLNGRNVEKCIREEFYWSVQLTRTDTDYQDAGSSKE